MTCFLAMPKDMLNIQNNKFYTDLEKKIFIWRQHFSSGFLVPLYDQEAFLGNNF